MEAPRSASGPGAPTGALEVPCPSLEGGYDSTFLVSLLGGEPRTQTRAPPAEGGRREHPGTHPPPAVRTGAGRRGVAQGRGPSTLPSECGHRGTGEAPRRGHGPTAGTGTRGPLPLRTRTAHAQAWAHWLSVKAHVTAPWTPQKRVSLLCNQPATLGVIPSHSHAQKFF